MYVKECVNGRERLNRCEGIGREGCRSYGQRRSSGAVYRFAPETDKTDLQSCKMADPICTRSRSEEAGMIVSVAVVLDGVVLMKVEEQLYSETKAEQRLSYHN